ncbi:MAG: phospholipid scramblase-related protein [Candidatus Caenarcaniphilales bacterium]|nr:phospholipid scramblase-related protein [Candidatus Caenarcaniphilales bacterium]
MNFFIPNKLSVKQKIELLEIFTGFETSNRYEINEAGGRKFLFAFEKSGLIWKFLLTDRRPLEIHMVDDAKREVFLLKRGFFWFFPSYELFHGSELVGKIKKRFAFFHTKYSIKDSSNEEIAKLEGPMWRPWTFNIKAPNGKKIGLLGKKFSGFKEFFTDSDNFSFQVDDNIQDNALKALILASTFAVDYDNFDIKPTNSN